MQVIFHFNAAPDPDQIISKYFYTLISLKNMEEENKIQEQTSEDNSESQTEKTEEEEKKESSDQ